MDLPPLHRLRPAPTAVFPVRELPVDLIRKVLDDVLASTPPEDLCSTLYERCLLLRGSGNCPPGDPIWQAACLRFGLTPQAGFGPLGPLGSWQEPFRALCRELASQSPETRAVLWMYMRGEGDRVSYLSRVALRKVAGLPDFREHLNILGGANFDTKLVEYFRTTNGMYGGRAPLTVQALMHFGVLTPDPPGLVEACLAGNLNEAIRLLGGRSGDGAGAMKIAIEEPNVAMVQFLLAAGVSTETTILPGETLLLYALRAFLEFGVVPFAANDMRPFDVIRALMDAGANLSARTETGRPMSELVQIYPDDGGRVFQNPMLAQGGRDPILWIKAIFKPKRVLALQSSSRDMALVQYCQERIAALAASERAELIANNVLLRERDDDDDDDDRDVNDDDDDDNDDDDDDGNAEEWMYPE